MKITPLACIVLIPVLFACSPTASTPTPTFTPTVEVTPTSPAAATPTVVSTNIPSPIPSSPSPSLSLSPTSSLPAPTRLTYGPWDLVLALAFSPDGQFLAVAAGQSIHIHETATFGENAALPAGEAINAIAIHPNNTLLAAALKGGSVQLWDIPSRSLRCTLDAHARSANTVAFSPDGHTLATAGNDAFVRFWNLDPLQNNDCNLPASGKLLGGAFAIPAVRFSPAGDVVASVDVESVILRSANDLRLIDTLRGNTSVYSLAFSPDGSRLAVGELANTVRLWEVATGNEVATLDVGGAPNGFVWAVAFSPDGKFLASGESDGRVTLWDAATLQASRTLPPHADAVTTLAFSPDGHWLASGSVDASVQLDSVIP